MIWNVDDKFVGGRRDRVVWGNLKKFILFSYLFILKWNEYLLQKILKFSEFKNVFKIMEDVLRIEKFFNWLMEMS